jgi:UDP-N-acetyl-2-amino-2-deoxyglucuronate dehydrogenase
MPGPYKIGLIGCGKIAQRHAEILGKGQVNGAVLAAVADPFIEKAEALAKAYNVPAYANFHAMVESKNIDAVAVLTPSGLHASQIIELAPYGLPIIVEKPIALNTTQADAVIEACEKHRAPLFVVKQNRFNKPVIALRKALEAGRFGKLVLGTIRVRWCRPQSYYDQGGWRGTWAMDGGVLTNQASHHIDLLEWMMGGVERVVAKGITALANIEAEDTASALLTFKNGAMGIVEATTAARPKDLEGSLSILGEKGSVVIEGFAVNSLKTWNFTDHHPMDDTVWADYAENPSIPGYAHIAYYDHIVRCLNGEEKPSVNGREGRKSLSLITHMYESIQHGKEVVLS